MDSNTITISINSISDNQMNLLQPPVIKAITSDNLIDYQCNDQGYDLMIDQLRNQLRNQLSDQLRNQL